MSIQWLFDVIENRKNHPTEKSYTASLFAEGESLLRVAARRIKSDVSLAMRALMTALPCLPVAPVMRSARDIVNAWKLMVDVAEK